MLEAPHQIGHPPPVHTDGSLGISTMAYQSEEIAFGLGEGEKRVTLLLDRTCTLTQRGKTHYCPCCTLATPVAMPTPINLGSNSPEKGKGMRIWQQHGPWAPRNFAAALDARDGQTITESWDWAATNFYMETLRIPRTHSA